MNGALFRMGSFTSHSGQELSYKIECEALTDEDWETLAFMLAERLPPFGRVEGVPRGGLILAAALMPHATEGCETLLICDDVCTTGASMEAHRAGRKARGAVVFARGKTPAPGWVLPLFTLFP